MKWILFIPLLKDEKKEKEHRKPKTVAAIKFVANGWCEATNAQDKKSCASGDRNER